MDIEDRRNGFNKCRFDSLNYGQPFTLAGGVHVYIKVLKDHDAKTGVRLHDGLFLEFDGNDYVVPVIGKFVVEY